MHGGNPTFASDVVGATSAPGTPAGSTTNSATASPSPRTSSLSQRSMSNETSSSLPPISSSVPHQHTAAFENMVVSPPSSPRKRPVASRKRAESGTPALGGESPLPDEVQRPKKRAASLSSMTASQSSNDLASLNFASLFGDEDARVGQLSRLTNPALEFGGGVPPRGRAVSMPDAHLSSSGHMYVRAMPPIAEDAVSVPVAASLPVSPTHREWDWSNAYAEPAARARAQQPQPVVFEQNPIPAQRSMSVPQPLPVSFAPQPLAAPPVRAPAPYYQQQQSAQQYTQQQPTYQVQQQQQQAAPQIAVEEVFAQDPFAFSLLSPEEISSVVDDALDPLPCLESLQLNSDDWIGGLVDYAE